MPSRSSPGGLFSFSGVSFGVSFSRPLTLIQAKKNPPSLVGQRVFMELLTRFELVTSSLPILLHLFLFVVYCFYLSSEIIAVL